MTFDQAHKLGYQIRPLLVTPVAQLCAALLDRHVPVLPQFVYVPKLKRG